jgi:hypothetical protein
VTLEAALQELDVVGITNVVASIGVAEVLADILKKVKIRNFKLLFIESTKYKNIEAKICFRKDLKFDNCSRKF